jgi:hypothetical protein
MLNHADVGVFMLGAGAPTGAPPAGVAYVDVRSTDAPDWNFFKVAALATGAFPIGLMPRAVERPPADFNTVGTVGSLDPKTGQFVIIPPNAGFPMSVPFKYWAVDGGPIDNEPLEQARRSLTNGASDKTDGLAANKAVVLVAPFPNYRLYEDDKTVRTLASVLPSLAAALINQARFKPDELAQARDTSNFARFIISPERKKADRSVPKYAIASWTLGGFSGFLDESFRRHDYLLGRRNAQAYLRWNFGLPKSHAIFGGKELASKWVVRDAGSRTDTLAPAQDLALRPKAFALRHGGDEFEAGYPIIPLTARMMQPIEIPADDQPKPSRDMLEPLRPAIRNRIDKVIEILVDVDLADLASGLGLFAWPAKRLAKMYGVEVLNNKTTQLVGDALDTLRGSFP